MAVAVSGLPPVLYEGLEVCVVPPARTGSRWHELTSVETSSSGQLVALSGVAGLGSAKELAGKWLVVAEDDLPEEFFAHDAQGLCGRQVTDERLGELGRITDVMFGPVNDVWVVEGERGETLIPVVDAIVVSVPREGAVRVSCPVGLVPGDEGEALCATGNADSKEE